MGIHDRDWFHEERDKRDAIPHPTSNKKPIPMKVSPEFSSHQTDLLSGSFMSGFFWGALFSFFVLLLAYLLLR